MTFGRKLTQGVGGLGLATMVVAGMGISSLRKMNNRIEAIVKDTTHKLQVGEMVDTTKSDMLAAERGMVLGEIVHESAKARELGEAFTDDSAKMKSLLDELRLIVTAPEGKKSFAKMDELYGGWMKAYAEFLRLVEAGKLNEGQKYAFQVIGPLSGQFADASAHFVEFYRGVLESDRQAAASEYLFSLWLMIGLTAIGVVAGALALWLVWRTSGQLQAMGGNLMASSEQVASAAGQISSTSQSLAQGSSEQAASLEETSASSAEISAMAQQNNENSRSAAQLMTVAQDKIAETNGALEMMEKAITEIGESSAKMSKIIKSIDEIAFQTNILALNAAVEAARAGEAGMGFAVVADEVRNLAQRSAQAAKDTANLIEESIARSTEGKAKVDQVAEGIRSITEQAAKAKTLVDEVSVGSQEQARGIDQVSKTVAQMEQVTQSSAASAEESASASEELRAQADSLKDIVAQLTELVGSAQ